MLNPSVAKRLEERAAGIDNHLKRVETAFSTWYAPGAELERLAAVSCIQRLRQELRAAVQEPCEEAKSRLSIAKERCTLAMSADALMRKQASGAPRELVHLYDICEDLLELLLAWPLPETGLTNDEVRRDREATTANEFLELYNSRFGTAYVVDHHREKPDFDCVDYGTAQHLYLEVTALVDRDDDLAYALGRSERKSTDAISWDDTRRQLHRILMAKSSKRYCLHPLALVVQQINPLWSVSGWKACARMYNLYDQYADLPFDQGVWILTWNDSTPRQHDIFCLTPPDQSTNGTQTFC